MSTANLPPQDLRRRVAAPARILLITAALAFVGNCLCGVGSSVLRSQRGPVQPPPGMDPETAKAFQSGADAAPLFDMCMYVFPLFAVYPLVFIGALRMQALKSYGLVFAASILALLPCSLAWPIGLVGGIWSLIVLNDPAVKSSFT